MKLLIAIPALNEEESIASIIERSLAAKTFIIQNSTVTDVQVTVVSDGSTDRTVEIANQYTDRIKLIVFPQNKGYGAAIKEAWRQSDADLLGFLDADGTCDPNFFATLCRGAVDEHVDVVLGCRLNKDSKMPLVRRVGNILFATLLNFVASMKVRDTASGMRVVRRSSLEDLYPLPDGLHFTPAMSARAILSRRVKILELDMPYHERRGESKLQVINDGLRFVKVILQTALLYRPARLLNAAALVTLLVPVALMIQPTLHYLRDREVAEWMIYRFIVSQLAVTGVALLVGASFLSTRMVGISLSREAFERRDPWQRQFFYGPLFWGALAGLVGAAALLVFRAFVQLATTGNLYEHWSRFIVMSGCLSVAMILVVTRVTDHVLGLVQERLNYLDQLTDLNQSSAPAVEAQFPERHQRSA